MTDTDRHLAAGAKPSPSRVVIAIDPPGEYGEVLEAAARLAARLETQLEALLVEDPGLLEVARLPFTRAFDSAGRERDLDDKMLHRAWRSERHRLGEAMRRCAASLNVRATLRVVQGQFLAEALTVASQVDVTMLVHSRSLARGLSASERSWLRTTPGAPSSVRRALRRTRPIWVYIDGSEAAQRALGLAVDLAFDYLSPLLVLHRSEIDAGGLAQTVRELCAQRPLAVSYLAVSDSAHQTLTTMRRPEGCALVLAPREAVPTNDLPAVLDALAAKTCPLILVA